MLRIENLSKSFGTKVILADVSFHFPIGERIALVGPNGAGKTTLLNILAGKEEADGGIIEKPSAFTLGYLPQIANPNPQSSVIEECLVGGAGTTQEIIRNYRRCLDALTHNYSEATQKQFDQAEASYIQIGGRSLEATARGILGGLGFRDEAMEKHPLSLSGGWRMRIELAKILVHPSDFLILDEPTNHLDLPSMVWVERFLRAYRGTLLMVSHDRSLLERLPTYTLYLHHGKMTPYHGNFSYFLEEKERQEESDAAAAANLRKRRQHLEKFVERFGAKASKATQAQSRMKMIARIKDLEKDYVADEDPETMVLRLPEAPASGKLVLSGKDIAIGYEKPLATKLNLEVLRGQKIAVIGLNGIGKSTLLKSIASDIALLSGKVEWGHQIKTAYFAQDQEKSLNPSSTILAEVMSSSETMSERQARQILGHFLFSGDDVHKRISVLSGGEKSRVGLAKLLSQPANFLMLDEPTNHLDISSIEVLASALEEYNGAILFVSHDRGFIETVATHIFAMLPDGRSGLFEGSLEDYARLAQQAGLPNVFETVDDIKSTPSLEVDQTKPSSTSHTSIEKLRKERQTFEKRQKQLDKELTDYHTAVSGLEHRLAEGHLSHNEAQKQGAELTRLRAQMEAAEEEWIECGAKVEELSETLRQLGRL